jgi:hypothetical protein
MLRSVFNGREVAVQASDHHILCRGIMVIPHPQRVSSGNPGGAGTPRDGTNLAHSAGNTVRTKICEQTIHPRRDGPARRSIR